ncbi:hypothetical protein [Leucothrix pacifica]|nr:hypothetical protein [Leucothrix pacifica]
MGRNGFTKHRIIFADILLSGAFVLTITMPTAHRFSALRKKVFFIGTALAAA